MEQITLGELIVELSRCNPDTWVRFDFGGLSPDDFDSYRGYYNQLALGYSSKYPEPEVTVGQLLQKCRETVGKTFQGYKGGDYVMSEDTPLWAANYSESTHCAIVGVEDAGWVVVLNTAWAE